MDGLVQCPFDKSHRILKSRLQYHINRDHKKEAGKATVACPFNSQHLMTSGQIKEHVANCPQRKTFENLKTQEELSTNFQPAASDVQKIVSSENWDDEPDVPTYNAKKILETKPVLRSVQGPPSEKKRFRVSERLRLNNTS